MITSSAECNKQHFREFTDSMFVMPQKPAQQPQREHCDHECVCERYKHSFFGVRNLSCDTEVTKIVCSHDTRTRSHPPAPEQCPYWGNRFGMMVCKYREIGDARDEHDSAIARTATLAERERVLGDVEGVVAFCNALHADPLEEKTRLRIRAYAESLRQSTTAEKQERP
jgi:hypothetical protein